MIRFGFVVPASVLWAVLLLAVPTFADDQAKDQSKTPPPAPTQQTKPVPVVAPHKATPKEDADSLVGKEVFGADGTQMGLVTNVLVDRDGHPIALVIDFGGFLGVGTRKIAIDWHLMEFHPGNKTKPVTLKLDKDQLKSAPEYKPDKPARILGAPAMAKPPDQPAPSTTPPGNNGTK